MLKSTELGFESYNGGGWGKGGDGGGDEQG